MDETTARGSRGTGGEFNIDLMLIKGERASSTDEHCRMQIWG
jgi:hypothetical protein